MNTRYRPANAKLTDCLHHGPGSGAELLLVEGDSAAASVCAVRNEQNQAVLALQGKPLNAWHASAAKVAAHAQYRLLAQAMAPLTLAPHSTTGAAPPHPPEQVALPDWRYARVVLMFDPDADGIHIGALLVLYMQRWWPQLITQGRLWQVRAPMFELVASGSGDVQQADNPVHCLALTAQMALADGGARPRVQAYRGLGSIAPDVLRSRCVDPATRRAFALSANDVQAVVDVFGGGSA